MVACLALIPGWRYYAQNEVGQEANSTFNVEVFTPVQVCCSQNDIAGFTTSVVLMLRLLRFASQELDQVSADIASKYILKLVDDDALAVATVRTMQS
mgnify:CR=1 FL=1